MRILRSTHSVNPAIGGPIESIRQSSRVLLERGHQVEIVSLDSPNDQWVRDCPVRVHALGPGRGSYGYTGALTPWLRAHRHDYDAVIVHGLWQYSGLGVWHALRGGGPPYFVFPHGMLDPWFNRTYPLKHLKKLLYWPWAERRILRDAAAVLFTSEEERRLARESFPGYRCREAVVNYGTAVPEVDLEAAREQFLQSFPQLRGQRMFLFLSRLHEKKGCDLLIRAFAAIRASAANVHLVMAGPAANESYLEHLTQLARGAGAEAAITFTGMLTGNLKWGAFATADAFVLPSHQENFGIAVAEALACGVPVLISNKVNIWREIEANGAGYIENDDLAGTHRLLERWEHTPLAEADAMRALARECFHRHFHIERATDSLLSVLSEFTIAK
jgi:glycosyltransferase involved in cell wall biosynthesis